MAVGGGAGWAVGYEAGGWCFSLFWNKAARTAAEGRAVRDWIGDVRGMEEV